MKIRRHAQAQRGAALLVVLATLFLVLTACASLARIAGTLRARRELDRCTATADDLLSQAQAAISAWLERESTSVSLGEEIDVPQLTILNDVWDVTERSCSVRITAFDQNGLVPYEMARAGSPLRATLPRKVLTVLDGARQGGGGALGLDQFQSPTGRPSPFPAPRYRRASVFGERDDPPALPVEPASSSALAALGAWVATYHRAPGRININTAPMPVVEETLRMAGLGGIERIREARAGGFLANLGALGGAPPDDQGVAPELVPSSDAWAFRIDIRVGLARRSWWSVYVLTSSWNCVQRLAITS